MESIELRVGREDVMLEVDKATDYTGSKLEADGSARDLVAMTEDDQRNLSRFWEEAASAANDRLKVMFLNGSTPGDPGDYRVTLEVSRSFDKGLTPSIESSLRSYFIQSIVGKWFRFANKKETAEYFREAGELLEDVMRKLYSRKRPERPRRRRG